MYSSGTDIKSGASMKKRSSASTDSSAIFMLSGAKKTMRPSILLLSSVKMMEVDFDGQTFKMTDSLTGEIVTIVVFVAVLPYSQLIYAEGMGSTKEHEPQVYDSQESF